MECITDLRSSVGVIARKGGGVDGSLLYVWAMTHKCVGSSETAMMLQSEANGEKKSEKAHSAKLVRPTSSVEFQHRLLSWIMVCHASGVSNLLICGAFVEQVVYCNLALHKDWRVVHELFVVYLATVEASSKLNLATVYESGGQDAKMKEAEANVLVYFRGVQGELAAAGGGGDVKTSKWNCAFDPKASKKCISYNVKSNHPTTSVSNGKCRFLHACDAWCQVSGGDKTQCGSLSHTRRDCDNPDKV